MKVPNFVIPTSRPICSVMHTQLGGTTLTWNLDPGNNSNKGVQNYALTNSEKWEKKEHWEWKLGFAQT